MSAGDKGNNCKPLIESGRYLLRVRDRSKTMANLASRFRGCLIGALVGDCFGAQFEFLPMKTTVSKVVDVVTVLEKSKSFTSIIVLYYYRLTINYRLTIIDLFIALHYWGSF